MPAAATLVFRDDDDNNDDVNDEDDDDDNNDDNDIGVNEPGNNPLVFTRKRIKFIYLFFLRLVVHVFCWETEPAQFVSKQNWTSEENRAASKKPIRIKDCN